MVGAKRAAHNPCPENNLEETYKIYICYLLNQSYQVELTDWEFHFGIMKIWNHTKKLRFDYCNTDHTEAYLGRTLSNFYHVTLLWKYLTA